MFRPFVVILAGLLALAAPVATAQQQPQMEQQLSRDASASLREDLSRLRERIDRLATDTHAQALRLVTDDGQRRLIDAWRDYIHAQTRTTAEIDPPQRALLDLWGGMEQLLAVIRESPPETVGEADAGLLLATQQITRDLHNLSRVYWDDKAVADVSESIEAFVEDRPLSLSELREGDVGNIVTRNLFSLFDTGRGALTSVLSIPLLPTRAVSGIREGTDELAQFNVTAARFTDVVEGLPEETRRQAELLLAALIDQETTLSRLMADVRITAAEFADTAQAIEAAAAEGNRLTSGVQMAVDRSREAAESYRLAADAIGAASDSAARLIEQVRTLLEETRSDAPAGNDSPTTPTFDPRAFAAAAEAIEAGAAEVTRAVAQIESLVRCSTREREPRPEEGRRGRRSTSRSMATRRAGSKRRPSSSTSCCSRSRHRSPAAGWRRRSPRCASSSARSSPRPPVMRAR